MENSQRFLFIDRVVDRFNFKNNQITLFTIFSPLKTDENYPKQGFVFTVLVRYTGKSALGRKYTVFNKGYQRNNEGFHSN